MDIQRTLLVLAIAVFLSAPAWAAEVDGFQPTRGAPGDAVLVRGSEFADDPVVLFGSLTAEVLKSRGDVLVCRVPDTATAGTATISVDGTDAASDFEIVAAGTPVVYGLSAEKGPVDLPVYLHGRRLADCTLSFVDADDVEQATAELRGGRRAAFFRVPMDLDAGTYTIVLENEDGQDTGDGSPTFEVVEPGEAVLTAIQPEAAAPGARVVLQGADLGPPGPCFVTWTDGDGVPVTWFGFSNGYDEVKTSVPFVLAPSGVYDVQVDTRGGAQTASLEYTLGDAPAPMIVALHPAAGPVGSLFAIEGEGLSLYGHETIVTFSDGTDSVVAKVLFRHGKGVVALVPDDLVDGDYDVTVSVGAETSDAATFSVGPLPLAVTRMRPVRQPAEGTTRPVWIEGSGFGSSASDVEIQVVWDDGSDTFEGDVVFRADGKLVVTPPGGTEDPLPTGSYTVSVILDPDGADEDSVEAGTYTVE